MNILFLSRWYPFPPNNGARIRISHLLQGLSQFHEITLLSFSDLPLPTPESLHQDAIYSSIEVVPWKPYKSGRLRARLGFFSQQPRSLVDTYSPEMDALIRSTLQKRKDDLVIASELSMAAYFPAFKGIPALFEEMELGSFYDDVWKEKDFAKRFRAQLTWLKLRRYISRVLDVFGSTTVVSETELGIVERNFPAQREKVSILPNGVDLSAYQDIKINRRPRHLIFSGSFSYIANYEAMQWFIGKVYPMIREQIPDVHLISTGDHANLPLPSLENVTLTGYVDDIKSLIASCDVSLAPIWSGGGTRLKILEAMALGTPVVATSKGAEGLLAKNGKHLLIADDPKNFAEQVINLLLRESLREQLSSNATRLVKDIYDWQVIMPHFLRLVDKVAAG
jgi:glycosyltransferase involved in cell wall biosynthesis